MAKKKDVQARVVEMYRAYFSDDATAEPAILGTDPNDFDLDPGPFYESLENEFGLDLDADDDASFGGLGGTIKKTIAVIAKKASDWEPRTAEPSAEEAEELVDLLLANVALNASLGPEAAYESGAASISEMDARDFKKLEAVVKKALSEGTVEQFASLAERHALPSAELEALFRFVASYPRSRR